MLKAETTSDWADLAGFVTEWRIREMFSINPLCVSTADAVYGQNDGGGFIIFLLRRRLCAALKPKLTEA